MANDWPFLSLMLWRTSSFNDSCKYYVVFYFSYIIIITIKINSLYLRLHVWPHIFCFNDLLKSGQGYMIFFYSISYKTIY
jgi:hypothetical protein